MIRRSGRLLVPAILLSVPLGLSGALAWQMVHLAPGGTTARAAGMPPHQMRPAATAIAGLVGPRIPPGVVLAAGITPEHGRVVPLRSAPRVLAITTTPTRLAPLETVTIAAALYANRSGTRSYTATVQLLPRDGGRPRTATQGGITLHPRQQVAVYWEWRAGTSLPAGVYTVRVLLRGAVGRGSVVASATAGQTVTVAARSRWLYSRRRRCVRCQGTPLWRAARASA